MMSSSIKVISVYLLMIFYLIFINIVGYQFLSKQITTIINPIFWLSLAIFSFFINRNSSERILSKTLKIQTILIIVLIYLMIYFSSGLFIGYGKSIYSHSILGIILNIWIYVLAIICQEYIRNMFVRNTFNKLGIVAVVVLFILFDINIYFLLQTFTNSAEIFKQTSMIIIPSLALNIFMMYTSRIGGFYACLTYRLPLILTNILLPILPSFDWYFTAILGSLLPFITFIFLKNVHDKKTIRESKRFFRKRNPIRTIPLIVSLFLFIGFVAGLFKYKPISIVSNSMVPIFFRGDVVVFEKIKQYEINKIENYDIIVYNLDNIIVIHRIIAMEKHSDGSISYITKGDNNNMADIKKVDEKQVIGVVKFVIPKIGYPSVWLNEFFHKKAVTIETGD